MAVTLADHLMGALPQLRVQPTPKRVRVLLDGAEVVDTTDALLVWEPMRIVASYAVPERAITATLEEAPVGPTPEYRPVGFGPDSPPLLDPSVPFAVHTAHGEPLDVVVGATRRDGAAFRFLDDPDVEGYVVLDFDAFDWFEEDEPIVGHARDPFHRIDVRRSSRRVRIEHDGTVLAESSRARLLFEGTFPMPRYYLPREDVVVELRPGSLRTTCAYKGHATHFDAVVDGEVLPDIAWTYTAPLDDATDVRDLVCFYHERLDLFVEGEPVERVRTPWS